MNIGKLTQPAFRSNLALSEFPNSQKYMIHRGPVLLKCITGLIEREKSLRKIGYISDFIADSMILPRIKG